jgi:DNA-directed RNA polymerase subunit RPC12/RpoP
MSDYRLILEEVTSQGNTHTSVVLEASSVPGWLCVDGCEFVTDEPSSPLYECGDCGETFNRDGSVDGGSNRCPQCNKFAAKIADLACDQCGAAEVDQTEAVECPKCGDWVEEGDFPDHLENHLA